MEARPARSLSASLLALLVLVPATAAGGGRCGSQACRADVSISGHAEPQPIHRGDKTELKITPKNDGPDGALAVKVNVDVPRALRIRDVRIHGGLGCRRKGTFVSCRFGDFASQQLGVARIEVKGRKRGTWIARARVFARDVDDPNGGNGQVSISVQVQ